MAVRPPVTIVLVLLWLTSTANAQMTQTRRLPPDGRPALIVANSQDANGVSFIHASRSSPAPWVVVESSDRHGGEDQSLETLDEAWGIALAVDEQLEAKRWGLSSAAQSLQSAKAQRWPNVVLDGSYTVRDNEPAFRFDTTGLPIAADTFPYAQNESFAFRTRVDIPLYTSGRIQDGIASASSEVSSRTHEVEDSRMDLKLDVAREYVAVLRAQREVEVTRSTVTSLDAHQQKVEMLYKHEQVPENDLLAAQVTLSNARQVAIQAANQLDAARAAYNRRLGRSLTAPVRISELAAIAPGDDLEALTAKAVRTRPGIARLTAQIRSLDFRASSLRAEDRPQVKLRGEYAWEENRFQSPEGITSALVGVSWNLFDGGRHRYQAAAISHQAQAVRRLRADLESIIALEVRKAWLDVQETRRRIEVVSEAVQRAEENLRVARTRYENGVGINTEVLDAETLRTQTYRNLDNATYDAVLAVLRLRYATGELKN